MQRNTFILFLLLVASGLNAQPWTPWQVPTPRQTLPISSDGAKVNFDQVNLVSGMKYSVHTEDRFKVANGNEFADGRYYINIVPFASGSVVNVGLKYQIGTAAEGWFNNAPPTQGYQTNHIYDASVSSNGTGTLSFRLFDRGDPPSNFYNDNSGNINVTVARETPGIAVKRDTIFFPLTNVGGITAQLDSIQGYGTQGYQLETVTMQGVNPSVFTVVSERTVPFGLKDATNEFQFTFSPPSLGNFSAEFHLHSSSAWGADKDRIIYLIGQSTRANIRAVPDTLDFGTITKGTWKDSVVQLVNSGGSGATIFGVSIAPSGQPFSVSGLPVNVAGNSQESITVRFAPLVNGNYFARFDLATSDGDVVTFYARGVAGQGIPRYNTGDTLDFGKVVLGFSKTLQSTMRNVGNADLALTTSTMTNPLDYSVIGMTGNFTYSPGSGEVYDFTFTPKVHIPNYGNHAGEFILYYTDQGPKTMYFLGSDHLPLDATLFISPNYYVIQGREVTITQQLMSDLSGSLTPIRSLSESITYDATLCDVVAVERGALISSSDWSFANTLTPGRIDISMSSSTSSFTKTGELVKITFRAKDSAPSGSFTDLVQTGIDFSNSIEPLAKVENGRITISDICTPVRLKDFSPGSFIEGNHPNPFNPTTRIKYSVGGDEPTRVVLRLYDTLGRELKVLLDE
ncbi:MAG TPA: choice-of-anchor D domain-containing protein, partial [Candidatus Kapabacteria bacterium]